MLRNIANCNTIVALWSIKYINQIYFSYIIFFMRKKMTPERTGTLLRYGVLIILSGSRYKDTLLAKIIISIGLKT